MKKLIALALAAMMVLSLGAALGETLEEITGGGAFASPKTMYVNTANGRRLNVRSEPRVVKTNLLGRLDSGTKVTVLGTVVINGDWVVIQYKKGPNGVAYVQARYLSENKPSGSSKKTTPAQKTDEQKKKEANMAELNRQLASARPVAEPFMIVVRPSRTSGWVNFRVGPGVAASLITSMGDGRELKVIGETDKWYQAIDTVTGKTGYISKNYVSILPKAAEPATPDKTQMGRLAVNGEFALQCRLPSGYTMQLINALGAKITAFITSPDPEKPILQLSIAFDETYSDVDRMNDLTDEDLAALEATFTDMNEVDISYRTTAYGTKLLVARETGADTDFVDIMSVYKGYFIEFVMSPSAQAANPVLTDAQIAMCVDFLSELDFVPVE